MPGKIRIVRCRRSGAAVQRLSERSDTGGRGNGERTVLVNRSAELALGGPGRALRARRRCASVMRVRRAQRTSRTRQRPGPPSASSAESNPGDVRTTARLVSLPLSRSFAVRGGVLPPTAAPRVPPGRRGRGCRRLRSRCRPAPSRGAALRGRGCARRAAGWPTTYCAIAPGQRWISVQRGAAVMRQRSARSARMRATRSSSGNASACGCSAPPTNARSSTVPSGARPAYFRWATCRRPACGAPPPARRSRRRRAASAVPRRRRRG